jgi:hypothetical protein
MKGFKGWYYEGWRHSLAAKGISTKNFSRKFSFQDDAYRLAERQLALQEEAFKEQRRATKAMEQEREEAESEAEFARVSQELAQAEALSTQEELIREQMESAEPQRDVASVLASIFRPSEEEPYEEEIYYAPAFERPKAEKPKLEFQPLPGGLAIFDGREHLKRGVELAKAETGAGRVAFVKTDPKETQVLSLPREELKKYALGKAQILIPPGGFHGFKRYLGESTLKPLLLESSRGRQAKIEEIPI